MNSKILLLALSAGIFSSCSTSYKSGQTPDDVYYSPVKYAEEKQNDDRDQVRDEPQKDYEISMTVRDRRWRDFNNEYDYNKSPYYYCNCKCNNYGYYYNPSYHPWPVYIAKMIPVNSTPRMVNLNAYTGYNSNAGGSKAINGVNWVQPAGSYNNSNNNNRSRNILRRIISPENNTSSSSSNSTRTYTPSSSSSSSGSSNSSSGSVSRPKRD